MKKALLYFPVELVGNENSGIAKKCLGITAAFKERYATDVFTDAHGKVRLNGAIIKDFNSSKWVSRLYNYHDILFGQFDKINAELRKKKYDIVYFRFHYFLSPGMVKFFRRLKKYNPSVKIYLELPCYPFEKEKGNGVMHHLRFWLNSLFIPQLKKYVSKIVTLAEEPSIWGIPTILISNGYYDPGLEELIAHTPPDLQSVPEDEFHLAMVARFTIGHAPEILIESLKAYYEENGAKKVFVHFIGADAGLALCRNLTKKYGLEKNIIFHGEKSTAEIVALLSRVHVCAGTLGLHRKNILIDSSLKSREYAAMGLPMILRTRDLDMDSSLFFVKYFPVPESIPDMRQIIDFFDVVRTEHPNYRSEIQDFARKNLSWSKKLEPVFRDAGAN